MTHTRVTPAAGLRANEIVRLDGRVIRVHEATEGALTYKGVTFPVVYVSGASETEKVKVTLPVDRILIAGR